MKSEICAAFAAACLLAPISASAEHMDVIGMEMTGACTPAEFMAIVKDFNQWGKKYDYAAKVATPVQSDNLATTYWLGTSPNAAKFGAAWDAWRDGQADGNSTPAKLQARFNKCSKNTSRNGYDVF